jgi:hypothetical protein
VDANFPLSRDGCTAVAAGALALGPEFLCGAPSAAGDADGTLVVVFTQQMLSCRATQTQKEVIDKLIVGQLVPATIYIQKSIT